MDGHSLILHPGMTGYMLQKEEKRGIFKAGEAPEDVKLQNLRFAVKM